MADNSILNNSYVVGIGGRNLVLNTFGRVYVKVQDKYYELDFKNSSSGGAGSSEIIIVDTKDAVQTLPYPGDHSFILTKDGFIYYTENNSFIPFDINSDGIKLVNPHIIGTITIDSEGKTPFVINSKTLVKNLNVEYLNGHNSDEFALLSENETVTGLWSFINEVFVQNRIYGTEAELDFATGRLVVNELIVKNGSAYTSYFEVDDYNNLYAKDERGIYSDSFISCRGLDPLSFGTFGYATEAFVSQSIAELVGAAPETLDTLEEIANAISGNQGVFDVLTQSITNNTNAIATLNGYFTNGAANNAIQLKNSRYVWGQEFNGTSDVSGHMYNVGNINFSNGQTLTSTVSGHLHLNEGFVSEGFISCRGLDASAAAIINSLGDITDVTITSPTNGQVLTYRDGVWVNEAVQGGGDMSGYLPLSGGTITGLVTFANNEISLNGVDLAYNSAALRVRTQSGDSWFGMMNDGSCHIYTNAGQFYMNKPLLVDNGNPVIHEGNIGSYTAGSATKLQTARTIWGQSFDGTGDIENQNLTINKNPVSNTGNWTRGIVARDSSNTIIGRIGFYGTGDTLSYAYIGNDYLYPWLKIDSNGNVGIGTANPLFKTDIRNNTYTNYDFHTYNSATNSSFFVGYSALWYGTSLIDTADGIFMVNVGCQYDGGGGTPAMQIRANKNAEFYGNIYASGGITARYASDIRLKEDIKTISTDVALATIMALNPITFRWNAKATELCSWLNGESQGFIAQDYEALIPNSGSEMWGEYRGIDYNRAIPYIVVVEQNHETRIQHIEQNHETRLQYLERENKELKKELQTLKREYYGNS